MEEVSRLLLPWYDRCKRRLPWRDQPDPYATWVSETMLQQTRVETVLSYYPRFMTRFPTVQALAEAPLEDVLKLWEGLGYYRRAQNLHRGAQQVMRDFDGQLPRTPEELRTITGIGPYTAGAIASIAFDVPCPAVDGNVIRVVSRVAGVREDVGIPSVQRRIAETAAAWVPQERPGDFNQALMDLGASLCCPGTPDCIKCPLASRCSALAEDDAELLPIKSRAAAPRVIAYDVALLMQDHRVLLRQRTETLLQGLWVFPLVEGTKTPAQLTKALHRALGLTCAYEKPLETARHVFTHQVWEMQLHLLACTGEAPAGCRFVTAEDISALPLPTAMRRAKAQALTLLNSKGEQHATE